MKIAIPKSRKELRAHLNDPLFANAYFLVGNSLLFAGSGFCFWIFAARFYAPQDVSLGSALISAMGLLRWLSMLGFDTGLIGYIPNENDKAGLVNGYACVVQEKAVLIYKIVVRTWW